MPGLHYTILTVPKIPCQNFWARISPLETCAIQLEAKMDNEVFVLYLLKNAFHKVQSSTKDTEEESSSIKKRKKTRKPLMFLAAIDRSV